MGWMWAFLPLVISPVVMLLLRVTVEYGKPTGMFNPKTQSWAYMFGDTIALPLAFGAAGSAWRPAFGPYWGVISLVAGLVIAGVLILVDRPNYIKTGNRDRLRSPTKVWHDLIVFPGVSWALVYLAAPALVNAWGTLNCWLILAGIALWGMLGLVDLIWLKPDPANQHPCVQDTAFKRFARRVG